MPHRGLFRHGGLLSPKSRVGRTVAGATAALLVAAGLVVGAVVAPAMAAGVVKIEATVDKNILAGESTKVELKASNTADGENDLYNASFTYQLAPGVAYKAGSSLPLGVVSEPRQVKVQVGAQPNGALDYVVLIWDNAADLIAQGSASLSFEITPNAVMYPVGSNFDGVASAFASTDERLIPKFDAKGKPDSATALMPNDSSGVLNTKVSAIEVTKSEPSSETELMRGVHDQTTTYTIEVRNTGAGLTQNVVVVDYLPAGLEFLGCGGADNSAGLEYDGSGNLGAGNGGTNCATYGQPKVETIDNRDGFAGTVFTKVTWTVGELAAGATAKITYAAGIPLFENTMWAAGAAPDAASGLQASNLDNNTGASTRQVGAASGLKNTAEASGLYQGAVKNELTDRLTSDDDSETVEVMDLAIAKSSTTSKFATGAIATFDLDIRVSEYTSASDIVITDVIPDGLCPLVVKRENIILGDNAPSLPADCVDDSKVQPVQGADVVSVTYNANGSFTLIMKLSDAALTLHANAKQRVSYTALMGAKYDGEGDPTVAGDSFVNTVKIAGTTTDVTGKQGAPVAVEDDSQATLTTGAPEISKKVAQRPASGKLPTADACVSGQIYGDSNVAETMPAYMLGDHMCFELNVKFAANTKTRNATVADFIPTGTEYVGFSVASTNTTTVSEPDTSVTTRPVWRFGKDAEGNTDATKPWFVEANAQATIYVLVKVVHSQNPKAVDITGNLMKFRQESTNGSVLALRDEVSFAIAADPAVALAKRITHVNGTPATDPKLATVRQGDVVSYTVELNNTGTPELRNNVPVTDLVVWDALPADYKCTSAKGWSLASTSDATAGVKCVDPLTTGYPPAKEVAPDALGRSLVKWTVAGPLAAGAKIGLNYTLTVPEGVSVSSAFENHASLIGFTAPTTGATDTKYIPTNSLRVPQPGDVVNAPEADDKATIKIPGATLAKKVLSTSVDAAGNDLLTQAVAGEFVSYEYSVVVPARTTVYNAVLADALPAQMSVLGTSTAVALRDGVAIPGAEGFVLTADAADRASYGKLTFPASYTNATNVDQKFTVTLTGIRAGLNSGSAGALELVVTKLENIAKFTSNKKLDGEAIALPDVKATVNVVVPKPTLTKTANPTTVGADGLATFTLVVGNTAGRPLAYDRLVTDCLPAGLSFGAATGSSAVPVVTVNGCNNSTGTLLSWELTDDVPQLPVTLSYTARLNADAGSASSYTNTAKVVGSTLNDGVRNAATEILVEATANAVVKVAPAILTKVVTPGEATIGQTVSYKVTTILPANANFYNSYITDAVPPGIRVDAASVSFDATGTTAGFSTCAVTGITLRCNAPEKIAASTAERFVTLSYTGTVVGYGTDNASPVAGNSLTNSASFKWQSVATGGTDISTPPSTAVVTVLEPNVTIAKAVSDTTPQPGERFSYTVLVSNTGANLSAAHNVKVTDTLPVGIDLSTVVLTGGQGGVLMGNVISWNVAMLAPNEVRAFTYSAVLSPSYILPPVNPITNVADVTSYTSTLSPADTDGRTYTNVPEATATVTPVFPKIDLTKATASASNVAYRGESFGWSLSATNSGAGAAQKVTLVDSLPANWSYDAKSAMVSVAGAAAIQLEPVVVGEKLTWSFGADAPAAALLQPGAKITIVFTATPSAEATVGQSFRHINNLTSTFRDTSNASGNRTGSYVPTPASATAYIHSADLQVVKTAGSDLAAGTSGTGWTINVKNVGPDAAVGPFTVTDTPTLPDGVSITGASGTGWVCTLPSTDKAPKGAFTCSANNGGASLAKDASLAPITVSVSVAAAVAAGTKVPNTATVSGKTYDPKPENNTSTSELGIIAEADLGIVKANAGDLPSAGGPISWTITATNHGPSNSASSSAKRITITDTIPAGVNNASAVLPADWTATPAGPWAAGTAVTFTFGGSSLAVDVPLVIRLSGTVAPGLATGTTITNSATVVPGGTSEPTGTPEKPNKPNDSSVDVTPTNTTSMTITKTRVVKVDGKWVPATGNIVAGSNVSYLISVANTGLADAFDVSVADTLPSYLSFVSYSDVVGTWTTTDNVNFALTGALRTSAATPAGSNVASFVLTTKVAEGHTASVVNTASVGGSNVTPPPPAIDTGEPKREADLSIAKTHTGVAVAGGQLPYTLTVTNEGPSRANGPYTIVDTLPAGFSYVANSAKIVIDDATEVAVEPTIDSTGRVLSWVVGDASVGLPVGKTIVLNFDTQIAANVVAANYVNLATVSAPNDVNPANNNASDTVTVTTETTASVVKTVVGAGPFVAGTDVSYNIVVEIDGPSHAYNVIVEDVVPIGLTLKSIGAASDGWSWNANSGTIATLAPGSYTIPVVATIAKNVTNDTVLNNVAKLSWTNNTSTGPTTGTDEDDEEITVTAHADLGLVKTAVDADGAEVEFVLAGTQGRYTLKATNYGPSFAAAPLTIVDTLPVGLSYVGLSDALGWSCTPGAVDPVAGQSISCVSTSTSPLGVDESAATLTMFVQYDVNMPAGSFTNTATVSSPTDEGANTHPNTDDATVTTKQAPSIVLDKVAVTSAPGEEKVGDTVTYTFTAKNTGNVTLTGVVIADPIAGLSALSYTWPDTANKGVLLQGQTVTATATLTLTQAHFDATTVLNSARVSGTSPENTVVNSTDDATVTLPNTPELTLVKKGALQAGAQGIKGDKVNYTFTVTNTGNVTITGATIADPLAGLSALSYTWPDATKAGVLLPGEHAVATAVYTLTQADVDAGAVDNTATATGTPPSGPPVTGTDTETTPTGGTAALALAKTGSFAAPAGAVLGGSAVYSFTVTNTGSLTLHDVVIADPMVGLSTIVYTWPGVTGVLAPGQFATASANLTITQAHIDAGSIENTATATGKDPKNVVTPPVIDSETLPIAPTPGIELTKAGSLAEIGASKPGHRVLYTFEAVNTGNVTLNGVTIADPKTGLSALSFVWPDATNPGVLLPGQTVTATAEYALTQADINAGKVDNSAVATGTPPTGANVSDDSSTTVKPKQDTGITLDKQAAFAADGALGDTVNYSFTAVNSGNVTLTDVELVDPLAGLSAITYDWSLASAEGVLAPGETVTASATYTVTQADVDAGSIVNTATITGTNPAGDKKSDTDDAEVNPPQDPAIYLVKDAALAAGATGIAGDTVNYTFVVTNSGTVSLYGVQITDPKQGLSALTDWVWPDAAGTLLVGESASATATYVLTQSDVDAGTVANLASAAGTPTGGTPVHWSDDATVTVTPAPGISMVKTGGFTGGAGGILGGTIDYGFTVTNTGNVTLSGVTITDPMPGLSAVTFGDWPAAEGTLLPGESVTATASIVLTQEHIDAGEIVNDATATGVPPTGDPVESKGTVTLTVAPTPEIALKKTGTMGPNTTGIVGDRVDFVMTATNTGNVTLYDSEISDPMPGLSVLKYGAWPNADGVLAPGESVTVTASYDLTAADVANGFVTNTASTTGRTVTGGVAAGGTTVDDDSTAKVTVPTPPGGLSTTGIDPLPLTGGAALLLGLGAILLFVRRRQARS